MSWNWIFIPFQVKLNDFQNIYISLYQANTANFLTINYLLLVVSTPPVFLINGFSVHGRSSLHLHQRGGEAREYVLHRVAQRLGMTKSRDFFLFLLFKLLLIIDMWNMYL